MRIQCGIFHLPTFVSEKDGPVGECFAAIRDLTQHAERLGFDGAWFAEHHFQPHGGVLSAPSLLMAAIAAQTSRIRLGFGVVQVPFRHPLSIAEQVTTLDHLSGGRVDLGIGRGFLKSEYDGFGIDMAESRARFNESVAVICRALTQPNTGFEGQFFSYPQLSLQPPPLQRPCPPIWAAAALTPQTYQWAGRQGYHIMVAPLLSSNLDDLETNLGLYRQAWQEAGHPGDSGRVLVNLHVHISETAASAKAESHDGLQRYIRKTREAGASAIAAFHKNGVPADFSRYPALGKRWHQFQFEKEIEAATVIIGTPALCQAKLEQVAARLRCTYLLGTFDFGQPKPSVYRSMTQFKKILASGAFSNLAATETVPAGA